MCCSQSFLVALLCLRLSSSNGKAKSKPILHEDYPKNTTAMVGQNASMKCVVVSTGTPDFRWLKWKKIPKGYPDDIKFQDGSYKIVDPTYYVTINAGPNYGMELVIENVTEKDFGLYTCHVGNHIGVDHRSAFLLRKVWPTVTVFPDALYTQPQAQDVTLLVMAIAILSIIIAASVIGLASLFCYRKWVRRKAKHNENLQLEMASLQRLTEPKTCNEY